MYIINTPQIGINIDHTAGNYSRRDMVRTGTTFHVCTEVKPPTGTRVLRNHPYIIVLRGK